MSSASAARTFEVRHLQFARAAFAALAAAMITFSSDHSAALGLAVFSGFAIATALVELLAGWLVYRAGSRWPTVLVGALTVIAGMLAGIVGLRTVAMFFAVVISWAIATGLVELLVGWRRMRATALGTAARSESRDALTVGVITLVLGIALLFVPTGYALQYYIDDAHQNFILTGITIGVGVFGGYAAIVAVYLAIAAFSPRKPAAEASVASGEAPLTPQDGAGA